METPSTATPISNATPLRRPPLSPVNFCFSSDKKKKESDMQEENTEKSRFDFPLLDMENPYWTLR